jgi:hypothetical protein
VSESGGPTDISGQLLADVRASYTKWLGEKYDLAALDVVLCTAAAADLAGDPPWLQVVGGSGVAKTETIVPLSGAGAHLVSTISGEAGLLSGTALKERSKDATGGLLRKLGDHGLLVIKDFTSILSMNRDTRALILAALREIHDGRAERVTRDAEEPVDVPHHPQRQQQLAQDVMRLRRLARSGPRCRVASWCGELAVRGHVTVERSREHMHSWPRRRRRHGIQRHRARHYRERDRRYQHHTARTTTASVALPVDNPPVHSHILPQRELR